MYKRQIRDKDSFANALKEELRRHNIREKEVVFTLSSSKVVTREVLIPFVKDNKIRGIIDAQMRDYFPMDVSSYTVSYSTAVSYTHLDVYKRQVQGLSGSPIIQNGKIVGGVTHVLVNDPTRGYGIFVEEMLEH